MKISREDLIAEIKNVSEQHCGGKTPTSSDMAEFGEYTHNPYYNEFGSWNEALEIAGFKINRKRGNAEEELLGELVRLSKEIGDTPRQKDMDKKGKFSAGVYSQRFGSWNKSIKLANLEPNVESYVERDTVVKEIEKVCQGKERVSLTFMEENGGYSEKIYCNKFSWKKLCRDAGLKAHDDVRQEDLISEIKKLKEKLNRVPSTRDIKKHSSYSRDTYLQKFNSYPEALESAGLKPIGYVSGKEHPLWKGGMEGYYGSSWRSQRDKTRQRDNFECRICSSRPVHVHHIEPQRKWNVEKEHEKMNSLENLICLCVSHHNMVEGKWQDSSPEEFVEKFHEN